MILRVAILALLAFFIVGVPARAEEGFRAMIWGASKEDVRKYEKAVFYKEEGNTLYFIEQPDEYRRLISYEFRNGKLVRGKWEYVELHNPDPKIIMDMFGALQIDFEKKYGETSAQEFIWKGKQYLYYPQFWPRALRSGDLRMRAGWVSGDTAITLETYNDGMFYQLFYTAAQRGPEEEVKEQHILILPTAPPQAENQP